MKILSIGGARPNFVKIAGLHRAAMRMQGIEHQWLHTGQHYDRVLSDGFIEDLGLPPADHSLQCSPDDWENNIESVLRKEAPDWVIVVGDTRSTLAGAKAARRCEFPLVHLEAGLRSFDQSMPEEQIRIEVDRLADLLLVSEETAIRNLIHEGIPKSRIIQVGNIMADTLYRFTDSKASESGQNYAVCTFHRPGNVDSKESLLRIVDLLQELTRYIQVIWILHPRTKQSLIKSHLLEPLNETRGLHLKSPLLYSHFVNTISNCSFVVTDSGGLQEECTMLGKPCITLRNNTERPITCELGSNILVPEMDKSLFIQSASLALQNKWKPHAVPLDWDGQTGIRTLTICKQHTNNLSHSSHSS